MAIHYKTRGEGSPLVLLHGLFGSLENLGGLTRLLAEHYAVFSLDLPNHGRSAHTDTTSLEAVVDDVVDWMDSLSLTSAHILGHSLGGKVAMELALRHPERVTSLVVMDIAPVHYDPHHNQVFAGLRALDLPGLASRTEAERQLGEHVEEAAVRSFLLKNLVKSEAGGFSWRMNLTVLDRDYPKLIKENVRDRQYRGNTLFLKGGNSPYIVESYREEILARFPHTSLKVVANTGHWLHAEKPDIVAKLTHNFLTSTESKP